MIVVMEPDATEQAVESVISFLVTAGFDVHRSSGTTTTILGVVGDLTKNDLSVVSEFPGVSQVVRVNATNAHQAADALRNELDRAERDSGEW